MTIRLGTSGWSYDEWVDVFYPSKDTSKIKYYSSLFQTAEIDSTFYAYPSKGTVAGWVRNAPQDFIFAAKLPKLITHDKVIDLKRGVEIDLRKWLDLMEPVRRSGKLGIILIQLPPFFGRSLGKLEEFFKCLPQEYKWAVEFRNLSWLTDETWKVLRRCHIANTIVDEPLLPPEAVVTAEHAFLRWHGHGKHPWYNYRYSEEELKPWAKKLQKLNDDNLQIYGYFNNHFRAYAVENCLQMMEMLGQARKEHTEVKNRIAMHLEGKLGQTTIGRFIQDT